MDKILLEWKQKGQIEKIQQGLHAFSSLCHERGKKGIWNRDFANYIRNSGYIDGALIEMDVGSFYREDPPTTLLDEKRRYLGVIKKFVQEELQEKATFLDVSDEK